MQGGPGLTGQNVSGATRFERTTGGHVRIGQLASELMISRHDAWLFAAECIRAGGWSSVFVEGTELTPAAEAAIRKHVTGIVTAIRAQLPQ